VHAAPPVRVSLGGSPGWVAFVCVCSGVAIANAGAWLLLWMDVAGAAPAAMSLGVVGAGLVAWRTRHGGARGDLSWDGAQWQWQRSSGQAHLMLDLGDWMLLRFDSIHGERCWIAASRRRAVGAWPALRAALCSRRPADRLGAPPA
jgi:hypothetical protein